MFWYASVKADVSWSVNKKPKSNKLSKVWQQQQLFRQNHHILFVCTFKVWNLKLYTIMIHCTLLDFKDGQFKFFSMLDRIPHTTGWILRFPLRLWKKFSVFSEFEIVFGSHVIRFSAQSNVRLICYWSDWKGTYLTWPRNCLLWKGKMSTLPSVWKNLFCRHLV